MELARRVRVHLDVVELGSGRVFGDVEDAFPFPEILPLEFDGREVVRHGPVRVLARPNPQSPELGGPSWFGGPASLSDASLSIDSAITTISSPASRTKLGSGVGQDRRRCGRLPATWRRCVRAAMAIPPARVRPIIRSGIRDPIQLRSDPARHHVRDQVAEAGMEGSPGEQPGCQLGRDQNLVDIGSLEMGDVLGIVDLDHRPDVRGQAFDRQNRQDRVHVGVVRSVLRTDDRGLGAS